MATMNTAIPFAFEAPQIVNALAQGQQAAAQRNELSRMNALAQLYQAQGAGILAGEQGALNALAQFDPAAALGIQDTRQGMDARNLQMQATRQDMRVQAERWANELSEQDRTEAREGIARAIMMMEDANTPEAWDSMAEQLGKPELVGQFAMRDQRLMEVLPFAEALDVYNSRNTQPDPQSAIAKLQQDYNAGLITEEQLQIGMQNLAPSGMAVSVTPGGGVTVSQGPGVQGAVNIPERQSQIQLFGTMMDVSAPVINRIEETYNPANLQDATARAFGVPGNFFQSQDGQQYAAAASAWAEGALRLATGAAAQPAEIERITQTYFAIPGDTAETVAFKRQLRAAYENAIVAASGGNFQPGAAELPPDPLEFAGEEPVAQTQGAQITPQMVPTMSEEALAEYLTTTNPRDIPDDVWAAISARTGVQ